jgi:xanthine dehydrogenase iron-sulfur cluster and FAD-binding subunit A
VWHEYHLVMTLDEALDILARHGKRARILAGGTDLVLEMTRRQRPETDVLVDITRVAGSDAIAVDKDDIVHLGALVTHNQCVASSTVREFGLPLAQAAYQVGSPQIRNRGTIAGNLITGSPANDTIPALMALGAEITLKSKRAERNVPLEKFYTGVRKTIMQPDEMLVDIHFPALKQKKDGIRPDAIYQRGVFLKMGLRHAQAISVLSVAILLSQKEKIIENAQIVLGAVAPTVIHAAAAERALQGARLEQGLIEKTAELAAQAASPIDDIRSSAAYRREVLRVLVRRGLQSLANGGEYSPAIPERPPLLWGKIPRQRYKTYRSVVFDQDSPNPIETTINGKPYRFTTGHQKTLLDLIRDEGGMTGSKEGCAEGECGACTIYLDGVAVMACLVPAPRAHQAEITTIEGISQGDRIHPVQQAMIDDGAIQCGYCTPGFVMSGVKLLEENPHPTRPEIQHALTGNLCRCTGYYKIITAIEHAADKMA